MEGTHTKESILLFIEEMLRDNILQTEDLRVFQRQIIQIRQTRLEP